MILRRRYSLYYGLTFLAGARRQIFVAFAVFLMVERFGFTVKEITGLYLVNSLVTLLAAPQIGRLVGRMGERFVVLLEYSSLILVFWGYTVADSRWLLALLFVSDQLLFLMSMAIRTWFQKIADPADVAPSMAAGFTINHIAAVVIPPLGGLMWALDYRLTFYLGMLLACGSLVLALRMRRMVPVSPADVVPPALAVPELPQEA
jgi:predicted MFS family arabinose efflux permease